MKGKEKKEYRQTDSAIGKRKREKEQ